MPEKDSESVMVPWGGSAQHPWWDLRLGRKHRVVPGLKVMGGGKPKRRLKKNLMLESSSHGKNTEGLQKESKKMQGMKKESLIVSSLSGRGWGD